MLNGDSARCFLYQNGLPYPTQETGWSQTQSAGDFHQIQKADVSFSTLNSADVGPMKISAFCQDFL